MASYLNLEDVVRRNRLGLEQAILLIRIGALRFTSKSKNTLLWEAHSLLADGRKQQVPQLFAAPAKALELPTFESYPLEDAYDEMELLGFPLSLSMFDMVKSRYRGDVRAANLLEHVGKTVRIVGNFISRKVVPTSRGA